MGDNLIYDFDKQMTFKTRYMAKNSRSSQEYKHDDKSMGYRNL